MLFHLVMDFVNSILSNLYGLLPPWTITFGDGLGGASTDGGAIHTILTYIVMWDRFIPIHDCVLLIMGIEFLIFVGGMALKGIFKFLSFIPTIGAGG